MCERKGATSQEGEKEDGSARINTTRDFCFGRLHHPGFREDEAREKEKAQALRGGFIDWEPTDNSVSQGDGFTKEV